MPRVTLRVEYEHGPGAAENVVSFEAAMEADDAVPVEWVEEFAARATTLLTADGFARNQRRAAAAGASGDGDAR
jgi:hypothetical protein